jgi:hypothetical protein
MQIVGLMHVRTGSTIVEAWEIIDQTRGGATIYNARCPWIIKSIGELRSGRANPNAYGEEARSFTVESR